MVYAYVKGWVGVNCSTDQGEDSCTPWKREFAANFALISIRPSDLNRRTFGYESCVVCHISMRFGLFSAPWRTRQAGNAYNSSGGLSRLGRVLSRWPRRNSFSEQPISVICRSYSRQSGFVSLQVMSPKMGEEPLFEPARWLQNNRSASSRATVRARDDVVCSLIQQRFP